MVPHSRMVELLEAEQELAGVKAERDAARAWAALWKRKATISRYSIRDLRENVTGLYEMWRKERTRHLELEALVKRAKRLCIEALTPKKETT